MSIEPKQADPELINKVAMVHITNPGITPNGIAVKLGAKYRDVKRAIADPRFTDLISVSNPDYAKIVEDTKRELVKLARKAVRVVEARLDEDDLEAAKLVFKSMGIDQQEEKQADTTLTIVMPGQQQEKVIEVVDDTNKDS